MDSKRKLSLWYVCTTVSWFLFQQVFSSISKLLKVGCGLQHTGFEISGAEALLLSKCYDHHYYYGDGGCG